MRLSEDKVRAIAERLHDELAQRGLLAYKEAPSQKPGTGRAARVKQIYDFIIGDLRKEEEIDAEVERILAPSQLLDHVAEVVPQLARSYRLMLITKGDLFDQETKLARSALGQHFTHVEIVSDKSVASYRALFDKYKIDPAHFLMVGNSLRSDILPVTALGARAVYIPYHLTWAHEAVDDHDPQVHDYVELEHIGLLPALIEQSG